ncbi:MAG: DinB family protein [Verrucomicrobiota bacterium]
MLALIIRNKFRLSSRTSADATIRKETTLTLELARELHAPLAEEKIRVPKMIGIDEDMRDWSVCQTLEHNTIVNHSITRIVQTLAKEEPVVTNFNPKTDVMPSADAGADQIEAFEESVKQYFAVVEPLESLDSQTIFPHPIFGNFNAHQWHCMFGFHLMLHRKQIAKAVDLLKAA